MRAASETNVLDVGPPIASLLGALQRLDARLALAFDGAGQLTQSPGIIDTHSGKSGEQLVALKLSDVLHTITLPIGSAIAYQVISLQSRVVAVTIGKHLYFYEVRGHLCNIRRPIGYQTVGP